MRTPQPALAWVSLVLLGACLVARATANHAQAKSTRRAAYTPAALHADPLQPRLHWFAAYEAWNQAGDRTLAIAHLRAAVELDRHSMQAATQAAELLTPHYPDEAAWFWQEALWRCRTDPGLGRAMLQEAWRQFPDRSTDYWAKIIIAGQPRLLLLLARCRGRSAGPVVGARRHDQPADRCRCC